MLIFKGSGILKYQVFQKPPRREFAMKWINKRLTEVYDEDFLDSIEGLVDHGLVIELARCQHHIQTSRFQHCVSVSYYCYRIAKRFDWDYKSAARAGLLHDFYHYDINSKERVGGMKHLRSHPHLALKNAKENFELNYLETDIISKHMWPITLKLPKYKETWLIVGVDKFCALLEFFKIQRNIIISRRL